MARMHSKKKGRSGSKKPSSKIVPEWVEYSAPEVEELVARLGREGTPSPAIGQVLRDTYGVPSVRSITGKSVTEILAENNVKLEYPEDLLNLIKRAVGVRKHLTSNKGDIHNRVKLGHIESKIRRLVKYYTRTGRLPAEWRYEPDKAALLVK